MSRRIARWATALALVLTPAVVHAQTDADRAGVRQAALDYVEGFYLGDSTRFVRSVRPDVYKYGFWRRRDSTTYTAERMTWPEFHAFANRVKASNRQAPATAPKEVTVLDVQDQTAVAKVVAYWGTDYLLLGKYDGRWMIAEVMWQSYPPKATASRP
jgi:hypothetical protein